MRAWGEHMRAWGEHMRAWGEHMWAWDEHMRAWVEHISHGEFLRFLYILAHRRTKRWFERLGYEPSEEAFKFRRG